MSRFDRRSPARRLADWSAAHWQEKAAQAARPMPARFAALPAIAAPGDCYSGPETVSPLPALAQWIRRFDAARMESGK